jgi:hypothetical protein
LASHFWCFSGNNIDKFSVGGKKNIELRANFFFVDLVIEVVDIQSGVRLNGVGHDFE